MRLDDTSPSQNVELAFCHVATYRAEASPLPAFNDHDGAALVVAAIIVAALLAFCFAAFLVISDGTGAGRPPRRSRSTSRRASRLR